MKSITYSDLLKFEPCYLYDEKKKSLMDSIAQRKERWTALDILELEGIPYDDRLWAALQEGMIDEDMFYKFARACVDRAINLMKQQDPRSIAKASAESMRFRREIAGKELTTVTGEPHMFAIDAAWKAAVDTAHMSVCSSVNGSGPDASGIHEDDDGYRAALDSAFRAERAWQVEELKKLLVGA